MVCRVSGCPIWGSGDGPYSYGFRGSPLSVVGKVPLVYPKRSSSLFVELLERDLGASVGLLSLLY